MLVVKKFSKYRENGIDRLRNGQLLWRQSLLSSVPSISLLRSERSERAVTGFKKNVLKGVQIIEFVTFYQNALHLTRVHLATFYQSALRCELQEDAMPSSRVDSSKKGLMVVMFCSDLPVKRCEDRT